MMSETVVNVQDGSTTNGNNPRRGPTVKTEPGQTSIAGGIQLNIPYFKSIPGIIKIAELIVGIICMICASSFSYPISIAILAFVISALWTVVYLLSIREWLKIPINWILSELLATGGITVFYAIAFIVQLATSGGYGRFIAAGIFELINTLIYAGGTYFLYLEWKNVNDQ